MGLFQLMVFRQPSLVCFDEVVAEGDDIVDRKLGGGVRLEHCGVVDMLLFLGNSRLNGEELYVDVGHVHCRELNGQASDVGRLNTKLIYKAGNFYASICGQVVDKSAVEHVTADLVCVVGNDRFHDPGCVFVCSLVGYVVGEILLLVAVPARDLIDAAAGILVKRNSVTLDELGVLFLDEEVVVLRIVLARLGAVVAKAADIFKSDKILEVLGGILEDLASAAADLGVEVVAVCILKLKKERHVVDARDLFADGALRLKSDFLEKSVRADLNAVAKTYGLDGSVSLHKAGEDRHGVGVVEEESLGADLSHILCEIVENGDGAESAENAADAEGVGDGLTESVLLRDLEVDDGARVVTADLDGVNYEGSIAESILAFSNAEVLLDSSAVFVDILVEGADHYVGLFKSFGVDIVKSDFGIPKGGSHHNVAEHVLGKNSTARAHKCDLDHFNFLLLQKSFWLG